MAKDAPEIIKSQLDIATSKPIILITLYLDDGTKYWATKEIYLDGNRYSNQITKLGSICQTLNPLTGGIGTISDFHFSLFAFKKG